MFCRFHSDTQIYRKPSMHMVNEDPDEDAHAAGINTSGQETKYADARDDSPENSTLHLPRIGRPQDATDRYTCYFWWWWWWWWCWWWWCCCCFRLPRKPDPLGASQSGSLPNLASVGKNLTTRKQETSSPRGNYGNYGSNEPVGPGNEILVPGRRTRIRRKSKKQVPLSDRIHEFYKKLDDFSRKTVLGDAEREFCLPPLLE